jgi:hypothetical protein
MGGEETQRPGTAGATWPHLGDQQDTLREVPWIHQAPSSGGAGKGLEKVKPGFLATLPPIPGDPLLEGGWNWWTWSF